jgi:hypothetical protein
MADEFNGTATFVEAQQKEITRLQAKIAAQEAKNLVSENN